MPKKSVFQEVDERCNEGAVEGEGMTELSDKIIYLDNVESIKKDLHHIKYLLIAILCILIICDFTFFAISFIARYLS
jgi:hypothetical protein